MRAVNKGTQESATNKPQ